MSKKYGTFVVDINTIFLFEALTTHHLAALVGMHTHTYVRSIELAANDDLSTEMHLRFSRTGFNDLNTAKFTE
jgi:6-pyruvoyl-tetrahydropterin synthase